MLSHLYPSVFITSLMNVNNKKVSDKCGIGCNVNIYLRTRVGLLKSKICCNPYSMCSKLAFFYPFNPSEMT